jgi:hypothetical protein
MFNGIIKIAKKIDKTVNKSIARIVDLNEWQI